MPIRVDHPISRTDPLRVVLLGDSMLAVSQPGVVAALDATGEVVGHRRGVPGVRDRDRSRLARLRGSLGRRHPRRRRVLHDGLGRAARPAPRGLPPRPCSSSSTSRASAGGVGRRLPPVPEDPDPAEAVTPQPAGRRRQRHRGVERRGRGRPRARAGPRACTSRSPRASSSTAPSRRGSPPPRDPAAPRADVGPRSDASTACTCARRASRCTPRPSRRTPRRASALPAPQGRWWVNGWQRAPIVQQGDEFCPADHPAP